MMQKKARGITPLAKDPYLKPYLPAIEYRQVRAAEIERRLTGGKMDLSAFASAHEYYGLHFRRDRWFFREWAPNASSIFLIGDFNGWRETEAFALTRVSDSGAWEISLPADAISHGQLYKLRIHWKGGSGERVPAYARRVVQDPDTLIFSAQVWHPLKPYRWKTRKFKPSGEAPLVYEAHVGMAQERPGVGSYLEFAETTLPRIIEAGYNTIQLMAVMEHPYYGSFGYHVSSFFAASSRFGTPEELKHLIDTAHSKGIAVIIDLVHSHAAANEVEGLGRFDGTEYQYFHEGERGRHPAWGSRCFDYSKPEVLHFLLSNCRYWLDEFHVDGFRFDGITSMLYHHHGLGPAFNSYDRYFDSSVDDDALTYLFLANKLIHMIRPGAVTVAEDVSGMPGLAAPAHSGGTGFTYRLAMGVPDFWFHLLKKVRDEDWSMQGMWHELTNRRQDEKTISYVESHDQAIVGDKTSIFWMIDSEMYTRMRVDDSNPVVDRGLALHKMMRLVTASLAGHGYLNFMGNEFGHPEWIDFPREGNGWSYHYARRQWSLRDNLDLKYHFLADFDMLMTGILSANDTINRAYPMLLKAHDQEKILIFERAGLLFIFNFHPDWSFPDYTFEAPPGKYDLILNTDSLRLGGHGRIRDRQRYHTQDIIKGKSRHHYLSVYIPCRTALVLKKTPQGSGQSRKP